MKLTPFIACALALATACSDPAIEEYEPHSGIITGTLFYPSGTARGNAIVLLFREDDPPPPIGTGRPVSFIVVPASQLFKGAPADEPGDFAAPYTLPTVPAGRYTVRAFLDADGDFNPIYDLLGQPTAGDVGGGHIDLTTRAFLPVEVQSDRATTQVTVTLGQTFIVERPAFAITSSTTFSAPVGRPSAFSIRAHPIERTQLVMDPMRTRFLVSYADEDADGVVDDVNGDHLPDVYPKVVLRRVATATDTDTIIVPLILSPMPYLDRLDCRAGAAECGFAFADELSLLVPPAAVLRSKAGSDTILGAVPPGRYETIVISGTGQTWQLPNNLDLIQPMGGPDPTQSVYVDITPGPTPPPGLIRGTVKIDVQSPADAYVFAFDAANPPPPVGTGRPLGLATVKAASFVAGGLTQEAPFTLAGLRPGRYLVRGLLDVDGRFSPLVDLLAQPSATDRGGGSVPPVIDVGTQAVEGVTVDLTTVVPVDRPAFAFAPTQISRAGFPARMKVEAHPIAVLGMTEASTKLLVQRGAEDADGDNLIDSLPRVLLTRMADGGSDPRSTPDDPASIVIPAIVDPIPFLGLFDQGVPVVPAASLDLILPPVAVRLLPGGGRQILRPPPAGNYRVNLLAPTGQTWSVPNELDLVLARGTGPLADPTQAQAVVVSNDPLPGGAISGMVQLLTTPPAGDFSVIIFAFDVAALPPPRGSGRPLAISVLTKPEFGGGTAATYTLAGLPSGQYQVRAFLDADDDFTPWFDVRNQPDGGDLGGGYFGAQPPPAFATVQVNAGMGATTGIDVVILDPLRIPVDRPAFTLVGPDPVLSVGAAVTAPLTAANLAEGPFVQAGVFPVQWVDLDGNGMADDRAADGLPDVYPIVVAELLDPNDPLGLTPATPAIRVPGFVDPSQFAGFPYTDLTAVQTVVPAPAMNVVFRYVAVDSTGQVTVPPPGRYRITLINGFGQTWTIPNELSKASGTTLATSQARYLTVR